MTVYKQHKDHIAHHRGKRGEGPQFGASVGRTLAQIIGRPLTTSEARTWRKHGVLAVA